MFEEVSFQIFDTTVHQFNLFLEFTVFLFVLFVQGLHLLCHFLLHLFTNWFLNLFELAFNFKIGFLLKLVLEFLLFLNLFIYFLLHILQSLIVLFLDNFLLLLLLLFKLLLTKLILFIPILLNIYRWIFSLCKLSSRHWVTFACSCKCLLVEALLLVVIKGWQLIDQIGCIFIILINLALPCLVLLHIGICLLEWTLVWTFPVLLILWVNHQFFPLVWYITLMGFPAGVPII